MDFGVFLPIANNGWIPSATAPQYQPSFELNRTIVEKAEQYGFGFALSMVKLRGYGGPTRHWDYALESFTLTAALAAVTERIKLYASVATLSLPPALVARMSATIDSVAPGRFGINIVSGWNRSEYLQMGMWPGDDFYDYRYDYAAEYVTILKELWAQGRSDLKGKFFQLDDCRCEPLPSTDIEIVCAGASPRGRAFAAEFGDYNFTGSMQGRAGLAEATASLKAEGLARGRDVGTYGLQMVIIADTDEEAQRRVALYNEGSDREAIAFMIGQATLDAKSEGTSKATRAIVNAVPPGAIVGSPATVAREIDDLCRDTGMAGIMLMFDDFVDGVERFGRDVMPLLELR
jgi:pyrimidine oxygenase